MVRILSKQRAGLVTQIDVLVVTNLLTYVPPFLLPPSFAQHPSLSLHPTLLHHVCVCVCVCVEGRECG